MIRPAVLAWLLLPLLASASAQASSPQRAVQVRWQGVKKAAPKHVMPAVLRAANDDHFDGAKIVELAHRRAAPLAAEALAQFKLERVDVGSLVAANDDTVVEPATKPASQPRPALGGRLTDWLARKILRYQDKLGIHAFTEERPFFQKGVNLLGLELGFTLSNLQTTSLVPGRELLHVVDPSGASNIEMVLWQRRLGKGAKTPGQGTWIELQGPAINTSVTPGELPIGMRFLGFGIVAAKLDPATHRSVGYTLEAKVTERTAAFYLPLLLPGLAGGIGRVATAGWAHTAAQVFSAAVPLFSGWLAVASTGRMVRTFRNPQATKLDKGAATAYAAFDWLRVAFPIAGTIGNVAVASTMAAIDYMRMRRLAKGDGA